MREPLEPIRTYFGTFRNHLEPIGALVKPDHSGKSDRRASFRPLKSRISSTCLQPKSLLKWWLESLIYEFASCVKSILNFFYYVLGSKIRSQKIWKRSLFSIGFLTLAGIGRAWFQHRGVGWSVKGLLLLEFSVIWPNADNDKLMSNDLWRITSRRTKIWANQMLESYRPDHDT